MGGLSSSPGRGPTGKLRNFKAMSSTKLMGVINELTGYGQDPEALEAACAAAGMPVPGHARPRPPQPPVPAAGSLSGANVVVTGKVEGESRASANMKLHAAGAHTQDRVTKETSFVIAEGDSLVSGSTKLEQARKYGVPVIRWSDAVAMMAGAPAPYNSTAPTPTATRNQPVRAGNGYRQVQPMKCKASPSLPPGGNWAYEVKWDGYRCIAHLDGEGNAVLASSSGKDFGRFLKIKEELEALSRGSRDAGGAMGVKAILDGEIVVLDEQGRSQFASLHGGADSRAKYVVFDVLEAMGQDVRGMMFSQRRELLADIVAGGTYVAESPLFDDGEELLAYAADNELEGIVAKRTNSIYREGQRGDNWLKIKLRKEQEFVVVGWTPGEGQRAGTIGSVLLAVRDPAKKVWVFCGSAGSGGTYDDFEEIKSRLMAADVGDLSLENFDWPRHEARKVRWVKPAVVVEVRFQRWTDDGKLWHPSIQGIREDKSPEDVFREES